MAVSKSGTPVKIHLTTTIQYADSEKETYELFLSGEHFLKQGTAYLKYDEHQDTGAIHTVVKMSAEQGLILRSGALKMRLNFIPKKRMNGSYESPQGTLLLTTMTQNMEHIENTPEGVLTGLFSLQYQLEMQNNVVGTYQMKIAYKEDISVT